MELVHIMEIKIRILSIFFLSACTLTTAHSTAESLIPRYKKWINPILKVIHQRDLSLYEFSFCTHGVCPSFYLNFKHSPVGLLNKLSITLKCI